jgi:hypothetical protein
VVTALRKNGHPLAKTVWFLGLLAFAAPAATAWAILDIGRHEGCPPGAAACSRLPELGVFFKHALDISWLLSMNAMVLIPLALLVALAAILARSPARAFIGVFAGPTAALLLPVLVVMNATYPGCNVNEGGGSCTFWGVPMGDSFTTASIAPWMGYIIPPVGFAAAVVVMAVAYIVKRQRA